MSSLGLLSCSKNEFENQIERMDPQELPNVMASIIAEMDREQAQFDSLSSQLNLLTDQSSAEFKQISTELIKSQNQLSTLLDRNMFCFNVHKHGKESVKPPSIVTKDTKPTSALTESPPHDSTTATAKKKVVKVTRKVVTRKVDVNSEGLDPQLKSIMESRKKMIKDYGKTSNANQEAVEPSISKSKSGNAYGAVPASNSATSKVTLSTANGHVNKSNSSTTLVNSVQTELPVSSVDDVILAHTADGLEIEGSSDTDTVSSAGGLDYTFDFHSMDFESEKVKERVFMRDWNPIKVLKELYSVKLAKETTPLHSNNVVNMESYLEQLPIGKKKTTLLKTWKRIYCVAKDGILYMYKSKNKESGSSSYLSIMGGVVEDLSNKMIGIDDKRGHYMMVRCASDLDYRDWLRSLYTQIKCSPAINYVRPSLADKPHPSNVIVVDLGSCSIRAGVLSNTATYPQLFYPCVTALSPEGRRVFGFDSYIPSNRANGLHYPVTATKKVDKYRINIEILYDLFTDIFNRLDAVPSECTVMLSTPHNFSSRLKEELLRVLFIQMKVKAANIVNQSLLTPYIYSATSGIVVDIGERIDIVAITDGYLVDGGSIRRSFGGSRITDNLNSSLMEYRLFTPVEHLVARLIKEKTCFVSQDYEDDLLECMGDSSLCEATVDLEQFDFPEGAHLRLITVDSARFKAPEGLLKSELFGVDSQTLPQLIKEVITKCPMDLRREMWQSIYLSGGTTLIDGFPERLEAELKDIAPPSVTVQVHASVHRHHAAYIGACILARLPNFYQSCISRNDWLTQGKATLTKWKNYFQG